MILTPACLLLSLSFATATTLPAPVNQQENWGEDVRGLRLGIHSDRDSYRFDETIPLHLNLSNGGTHQMFIGKSNLFSIYRIDVRQANGDPVRWTREGERQGRLPISAYHVKPLAAGESDVTHVPSLDRLYDLTVAGEYRVTAYRQVWPEGKDAEPFEVVSNVLTITIHDNEVDEE